MLIFGRERNQNVLIGDDIVVTVVEIRGDNVRLGITAPKRVPVDREEIRRAKERDRERKTVFKLRTS